MRYRSKMSRTGIRAEDNGGRLAAGARAWRGLAGGHISIREGHRTFFFRGRGALAPAGGGREANRDVPGRGWQQRPGRRGRREARNWTLENGIRLKIAGVDPPADAGRSRISTSRARTGSRNGRSGKEILFARSNRARIAGCASWPRLRRRAGVYKRSTTDGHGASRTCRSARR